jgi:twitching motility protein PilT
VDLLTPEQKQVLDKEKEIIFSYNFDKNLRFKINIFHQRGFLSATLRYVSTKIPSLVELGIDGQIKRLTELRHGLIIISGPFGSGRSTTAAAMLEEINHNRKEYIMTIEDPIEYVFTNNLSVIEQREVGRDTNSYGDALKYFQEEDGHVLFLEQMSEPAIIPLVLEIASGNSLVITTTSADSAAKTISSILDYYTSFDQERIRDLLASALRAVICQKILPRIGGGSKAVFELLLVNDSVRSIISRGSVSQLDNLIQTSRREGMISFNQALAEAVKSGDVSREDALAYTVDPRLLENLLR